MTKLPKGVRHADRLLAPRTVHLIGSRDTAGESHLVPLSNLTSVSVDPQLITIAVSKKWKACENLQSATGFTVSVPTVEHREGVWPLGARYTGYEFPDRATKVLESHLPITDDPGLPGPVLAHGHGWMSCRIIARPDLGGDHGVCVGEITHVQPNPRYLDPELRPIDSLHPLLQVTGNILTTTGQNLTIPYGPGA